MPIKNYSSGIKPSESLGKIQALLAEHGAEEINMKYENGKPVSLRFYMKVGEINVPFELTVNTQGMLAAMKKDKKVKKSACTLDQAERTAWKNKYEWLHIQLSEIEANQARIEQLLLGYAVTKNGTTLFEEMKSNQKLLT